MTDSAPLYHTFGDVVYRVHDELWAQLGEKPATVIPPGSDPRAAHRVFVTAGRAAYAVHLRGEEWRQLDPESLDRLLALALTYGRRPRSGEGVTAYLGYLERLNILAAEAVANGGVDRTEARIRAAQACDAPTVPPAE